MCKIIDAQQFCQSWLLVIKSHLKKPSINEAAIKEFQLGFRAIPAGKPTNYFDPENPTDKQTHIAAVGKQKNLAGTIQFPIGRDYLSRMLDALQQQSISLSAASAESAILHEDADKVLVLQ